LKYLAEFHEDKKFPEYCWGNWDPRSKLYGAMLLRCKRPNCFVSGIINLYPTNVPIDTNVPLRNTRY
jgi:hypothetical protein